MKGLHGHMALTVSEGLEAERAARGSSAAAVIVAAASQAQLVGVEHGIEEALDREIQERVLIIIVQVVVEDEE